MAARRPTTKANPLNLYAVQEAQGPNLQPDMPKRTGETTRHDRGHQPDHSRLGSYFRKTNVRASFFTAKVLAKG
jgi:hypothetical protein